MERLRQGLPKFPQKPFVGDINDDKKAALIAL